MELLHCRKFDLVIREDSFSVMAQDAEFFCFQVRTAVHRHVSVYETNQRKNECQDEDTAPLTYQITKDGESCTVVWTTASNLWHRKEYILECDGKVFRYYVRVYGQHSIGSVDYFGLGINEYDASGYFAPVPNELYPHQITDPYVLKLCYMTPPPFCYSFFTEGIDTRIGIALEAKPGQYNFDQFAFNTHYPRSISFSTDYWGYSSPQNSCFETAHILGFAGDNDLDILALYREYSFDYGYAARRTAPKYDWWKKPIFCGWGQQGEHADMVEGHPTDRRECATQAVYTKMVQRIEERELPITTIILDDKWQTSYGIPLPDPRKWPNMREFVDEQHAKGRKVVLWYKVWNGEGLTEAEQVECLCRPAGADPTSQAYIFHMQKVFHTVLSSDEGCFDCDGFKFDFANCMPLGEDLYIDESGIYGIELLKRMYSLLYKCTKDNKPDAMVNNSCCHPYFAEVTDQVRLHDYFLPSRSPIANLNNRFSICSTVMNEASIDTDAPGGVRYRDTIRYMEYAMELGVPALYFVDHPLLSDRDWDHIREWLNAYLNKLH